MNIINRTLISGTPEHIKLSTPYGYIINRGKDSVYASESPDFSESNDNIFEIEPRHNAVLPLANGNLYLIGSGKVTVLGSTEPINFYEPSVSDESDGITSVSKDYVDSADLLIKESIANSNFLDNPDFQVNQRGNNSVVSDSEKHFISDRWSVANANACRTEYGITIVCGNSTGAKAELCQVIEDKAHILRGSKVTLSALIDNQRSSVSLTIPAEANRESETCCLTGMISASISTTTDAVVCSVFFEDNAEHLISWIKLESGDTATRFLQPDSVAELAKCQRHYLPLNQYSRYKAVGISASLIDFMVPTPVTMRSPVTIENAGNLAVRPFSGFDSIVDNFSFSTPITASNSILLRSSKENHGMTDAQLYVATAGSGFSSGL